MKKFYFLFLFALIASISNLYAAEKTVTSTFKDKDLTVGAGEPEWESSIAATAFETSGSKRGVQFGADKGIFTLKTKVSFSKVKNVSVLLSSNGNGNTVSLKVGVASVGKKVSIVKKNNYSVEWTAESPQDGIVELSFNDAAKSIYIKSIAITYEDGTSCGVPTFSVEEGTYKEAQAITLTPGEGGAQVFYTINGGTEQPFIEPIKLEEDGTYKIAAYTAGTETLAKSATVTKTYVINLPLEEPYILCEDAAWLTEGANIIFASSVAAGEQKAMSKLQKTNNRGAASVTIGSAFNVGKETVGIVSKDADVAVFIVGKSNGHITFYTGDSKDEENNEVAGYLYAAGSGSGKNYLRTTKIVDPNAEWSVSVAANGAATIKAQGANTNNLMRYNPNNGNPGNPMFSCYRSGQEPVYIYLLGKTSSVSSMSVEGVKVFAAEGGVEVVAEEAAEVAVYTAAGQLVRQARVAEGSTLVNVAPGFYVVRANGTATKVIVR